jgi:hypothetical protein
MVINRSPYITVCMRNRIVGTIIVAIAILMVFIIYSFNRGLTDIINASCSHGSSCPMWGTIDFQTNMSLGITVFVALIGLYLVFFGEEEKVITRIKTIAQQVAPRIPTKANYKGVLSGLPTDEKAVLNTVIDSEGSIFQSEIIEKTGFNKVKVSRILDRLEGKNVIERQRRGMTNVVLLKQS